jgi:acyl carrier protein
MQEQEIARRLAPIFETVLEVAPGELAGSLSPETCAKWDSLNHIHLVNGIEEEFEVQLDFEEQMRMVSFALATSIVSDAVARK